MSYDPKKKLSTYHRIRALIKMLFMVVLCGLGAIAVWKTQKIEATEDKVKAGVGKPISSLKSDQKLDVRAQTPASKTKNDVKKSTETPINSAGATASIPATTAKTNTKPKQGEEDLGIMEDKEDPEDLPELPFDDDRPIFVLSLPHNGDLVMARYFECGGVNKVGRYWTHSDPGDPDRRPLGQCLQFNLKQQRDGSGAMSSISQGCGRFSVWSELQYIHPPINDGPDKRPPQCFDPVLFPGALEQLYKAYPQAIIVTVQRKYYPQLWLEHMPKDLKTHWKKWCNPSHNNSFPKSSKNTASSDAKFLQFYQDYYTNLQAFIDSHEGWGHVPINWDEDVSVTASMLEEELKLPAKCWKEAVEGEMVDDAGSARRPSDIDFPVMVMSLPLSGTSTSHKYFECGMGSWAAVGQWTPLSDVPAGSPPNLAIGQCLERNFVREKRSDVLKGCGYARVWSDLGYLRDRENNGTCYYPTLDDAFLEAFAKYYPHATIIHTVRDAAKWYNAVVTKNDLPNRWTRAQHCHGFPIGGKAEWIEFYDDYTNRIRKFAAAHVNMTYMEIPVSEAGGQQLQSIFSYHPKCWKVAAEDS